jgi:hypothetical protein
MLGLRGRRCRRELGPVDECLSFKEYAGYGDLYKGSFKVLRWEALFRRRWAPWLLEGLKSFGLQYGVEPFRR